VIIGAGPGARAISYQIDTTTDGRFTARLQTKALAVSLLLIDSHGNLLVRSDGASTTGSDERIDEHVAPGSYTLQVEVTTGAGSYVLTSALAPASLPFQPIPAQNDPSAIVTGDFNGDGRTDLADLNRGWGIGGVSVLLGNGNGSFQPQATYALGTYSSSSAMVAGDFNGDGRTDLAVTSYGRPPTYAGAVSVLLSNGDGTFQPPMTFAVGSQPRAIVAGAFNGDGRTDLAVAGTEVDLLLGNGDGTFQPPAHYALSAYSTDGIVTGDFNGDGRTDLAAMYNQNTGGVEVSAFLGNPDGSLQTPLIYETGAVGDGSNSPIVAGDFTDDGRMDLVVTVGDGLHLLAGNGDGSFQPARTVDEEFLLRPVPGDFNGDGRTDLAGESVVSAVSVLLGNGDGTFQERPANSVGKSPVAIATGDFNGDGRTDFATVNSIGSENNTVSVLLGDGDGTFQPRTTNPVGYEPTAIVSGDFNGDGRSDLAVANTFATPLTDPQHPPPGSVLVLLGNGDGTFQSQATYETGQFPASLVTGDFNGDGRTDLAVVDNNGIDLLLGNGDGTFQTAKAVEAGGSTLTSGSNALGIDLVSGDFNDDRRADLAVINAGSWPHFDGTVSVLIGNGDGTFRPPVTHALGHDSVGIVAGDFNADGQVDLAVANNGLSYDSIGDYIPDPGSVSVLLGNGDGTFGPPSSYTVGPPLVAIAAGNFTGDGHTDLAVCASYFDSQANQNVGKVSVLLANGEGTFQPQAVYSVGSNPSAMVASDFNGDGRFDLATLNGNDSTSTVLLGKGDGTFTAAGQSARTLLATPLLADVNGDGTNDVLLTNSAGDILYRQGVPGQPGSFEPPVIINTGNPSRDIAWISNPKQGPVLASVDAHDNAVSLFAYRDGGFVKVWSLATGFLPAQIIAADLNGVGLTDLVVRNAGDGTLSVFFPTDPPSSPPQFLPAVSIPLDPGVSDVQAVDPTGSGGRLDLMVTNKLSGQLSILRNLGDGAFGPPERYRAGTGLSAIDTSGSPGVTSLEATAGVAAAPFTSGGPTDLVAINPGSNTLDVLAGLGGGRFANPVTIQTPHPAQVVRTADFNHDGIPDLALLGTSQVTILLGNGQGGFHPPVSYDAGFQPSGLTVADVNGDGVPDLLIGNIYGDLLTIQGNGDGTFRPYRNADQAVALAVADLTGDGKPDFVYANQGLDRVVVQYGSDQTKELGDKSTGLLSPGAVTLADLNGDGIPDLIVANSGSNNVLVYPGLGNGQFGPALNGGHGFFAGTNPTGIAVANLNGQPDVIVANSGSNDVSILLGQGKGSSFTLIPGPRIKTDAGPVAVALGNLLGTGQLDLAVANQQANDVQVFPGVGGGFFGQNATTYAMGQAPSGLFLGNFDGTGTGIAALNAGSNTISLIDPGGVIQSIPTGGLRPSSGFAGDFTNSGFTDLVVGNNADGHIALFLGGSSGLSLSQTLFSPDAPSPTSLSFGGLSNGVLSFYVASAGHEAAFSLAFDLASGSAAEGAPGEGVPGGVPGGTPSPDFAGGSGTEGVVPPAVPGTELSPADALAQATTGTFQQVAQLLSLNGSSLDLVASLFTVAVVPGASNGELGVAGSAAGTTELASFLPGGSQGVGQGLGPILNHDGSGGSEVAAQDEDQAEGELASELVDRLPEWASLGMGLDEAWLKVRDSFRESESVDHAVAMPGTTPSDTSGLQSPSSVTNPTPARFAEDPKVQPGRAASADPPGPVAPDEVKGIRIEPPSRGVVDAAIEGLAAEPGIGQRSLAPGIELLGGFTTQVPKVHTAVLIAGPIVGLLAAGATIGARRFRRRTRQVLRLPL
jgi:hypothetical protein